MEAMKQEECIWKQKSRIEWLATTDLNTRYFHLSTIIRRRRNNIEMLKTGEGGWITERDQIGNHVVDFFQKLYDSSSWAVEGRIADLIHPVVTKEDNADLCALPTMKEIKDAIFQLGAMKAPGLDGFSTLFFQHYWEVVGAVLSEMVLHFFKMGNMLRQFNHSFLVLIPKVDHPVRIEQF